MARLQCEELSERIVPSAVVIDDAPDYGASINDDYGTGSGSGSSSNYDDSSTSDVGSGSGSGTGYGSTYDYDTESDLGSGSGSGSGGGSGGVDEDYDYGSGSGDNNDSPPTDTTNYDQLRDEYHALWNHLKEQYIEVHELQELLYKIDADVSTTLVALDWAEDPALQAKLQSLQDEYYALQDKVNKLWQAEGQHS